MISVSKLCCPVCWELLKFLNDDGPHLSLPGCHTAIYPVELPEWLPPLIVDKMTVLFKAYLQRELCHMTEKASVATIRKKHHVSHESESGISVASTTRDSDDDSVLKEWVGPEAHL